MGGSELLDPAAMARLREWGGPELVRQMITLFLENGRQKVDRIREGVAAGDLDVVERAAHSLRSSAVNLGAEQVHALADELEARAERREGDGLGSLADRLDDVFDRTSDALQGLTSEADEA